MDTDTPARERAFLQFCKEQCSSGADHCVWYRQIWDASWSAANASRGAEPAKGADTPGDMRQATIVKKIVEAAFSVMHHDASEGDPATTYERVELTKLVTALLNRRASPSKAEGANTVNISDLCERCLCKYAARASPAEGEVTTGEADLLLVSQLRKIIGAAETKTMPYSYSPDWVYIHALDCLSVVESLIAENASLRAKLEELPCPTAGPDELAAASQPSNPEGRTV